MKRASTALAAAAICAALVTAGPTGMEAAEAAARGPETGLPLPRFVSLKASKANVRRGPSLSHRVDWVFVRRGMPLEVTAEHGHWRRVRDTDEAGGWVHYSLLRGARTAVVTAEKATFHERPRPETRVVAYAEEGVILSLDACEAEWCEAEAGTAKGWVSKAEIWGVRPDETFD